jgi:hypothetical protein
MVKRFVSRCSRDLVWMKMNTQRFPGQNIGPRFVLALKYQEWGVEKPVYAYEYFRHEEHMKARFEGYFSGQCKQCLNMDFCSEIRFPDFISEDEGNQ